MELNAGLIQKQSLVLVYLGFRHPSLRCSSLKASVEYGTVKNSLCPNANLSTSFTSRAVAARALTHAGHIAVTRSSLSDGYATTLFQISRVCVRTPKAIPLVSFIYMWKWNGLVLSWKARTGTDARAFLKALKVLCSVSIHSKGCILPVLA